MVKHLHRGNNFPYEKKPVIVKGWLLQGLVETIP